MPHHVIDVLAALDRGATLDDDPTARRHNRSSLLGVGSHGRPTPDTIEFRGERVHYQLTGRSTDAAATCDGDSQQPCADAHSATRAASSLPRPGRDLIHSKLKPPLPAAMCIERPGLLQHLDAGSQHKLVLIAAPIGSGKTTLLTQWHQHAASERAIAWLSLDEHDNDATRLFSYLIGAVRGAVAGFDAYIPTRRAKVAGGTDGLIETAASAFVASLGSITRDLVLVLDDFQCLTAPALVRTVDFLLHRSPAQVHWIVCGRCLPELNTSPLRLSDQLATIDAADLNFDGPAIVQLSQRLGGRQLSSAEADGILRRTEGWVAGVKLALLAAADAGERLDEFTGSHCDVARYLGASVLQEQSADVREFLLASSIVDRMTGELCNALLDITHSQSLLERLERSQLFIQPLDSRGQWYRYHTLFLDFLRSCLRRDAALVPVLHERASRWYAEHQLYTDALLHAFAAPNEEWRIELVERCGSAWLRTGEVADVIRWSERLPRTVVLGHARICVAYIAALILCRRFDEAVVALREVEGCAIAGRAVGSVHLRLLHAMLAVLADNDDRAVATPLESFREQGADSFLSGTLLILQAYAVFRQNQFDLAWRLAMRARDILEPVSLYGFGYADVVASLAERAQGDMKAAAQRCERMFGLVRSGRRSPAWVNAATALACVRYEENRLDEARALCMEALPLLCVAATIESFTMAHITLARIKAIEGHTGEALQLLDYLHSVLESGCHARFLAHVCAEKIRLALAHENLQRARAVALEFGLQRLARSGEWRRPRTYDEVWERLGFAYAALVLHQRHQDESLAIYTALRDSARAAGHVYREVPLEAAIAGCNWRGGDHEAAFHALNRGFALTRGHGFTRSVFDETPTMTHIIGAALENHKLRCLLPTRYFCKFENIFGDQPRPAAQLPRKTALPLEPLTDREVDMLKLLAQGLSNQQISARSQIALSTAKWHLKNVFAKLDVSSRTGAIARARELQLID